jgi:arylsulfatase A-like enzyme
MFTGLATTHGSATEEDQRVPIIFYGRGVKPGEYRDAATPADVTPTLAALFGITMPQAEGQALRAALAGAAATSTRP